MAMTPEAKVKVRIRAILDAANVYYAMPIGTGYGNSGVPDFLCCVGGRFLAIEAKARHGHVTALQERALQKIKEAGGFAMVINEESMPGLVQVIRSLQEPKQ